MTSQPRQGQRSMDLDDPWSRVSAQGFLASARSDSRRGVSSATSRTNAWPNTAPATGTWAKDTESVPKSLETKHGRREGSGKGKSTYIFLLSYSSSVQFLEWVWGETLHRNLNGADGDPFNKERAIVRDAESVFRNAVRYKVKLYYARLYPVYVCGLFDR